MIADDLLEAAELLLSGPAGRPKQAMLKRSVSTAYHAIFHALAYNNVDALVGWGMRSSQYWETVSPVYRLIEHGPARNALARIPKTHVQAVAFLRIASAFIELQKQRMLADYDPKPAFTMPEVRELIAVEREAIIELRALPRDDRRFLASQIIAKTRPGS